jgi:hypothetical protein
MLPGEFAGRQSIPSISDHFDGMRSPAELSPDLELRGVLDIWLHLISLERHGAGVGPAGTRLNKAVPRGTDVVQIFPDHAGLTRVVRAILAEQHGLTYAPDQSETPAEAVTFRQVKPTQAASDTESGLCLVRFSHDLT